ncbi:MAG: hypothetical protein MUC87_21275 [Bacteroidia bacterium]|jgi:hypothetical protein|nr:hypothetical protein [Bacteroidia bacterium]
MAVDNDILFDKKLRTGGFYELAIQVCPSADSEPVKQYTDYIWSLDNVAGPFDVNSNPIPIDILNISHDGILNLGSYSIPFLTYNIREDQPVETGFNLFDICFYTSAIENVFGAEYQTWTENPKVPSELEKFFATIVKKLYEIYPFQLAILGFEVSGMYYLNDLKTELIPDCETSRFFVGQDNYELISIANRKFVTPVEEIIFE